MALAEETQLESLATLPALLGAMDAQRRVYQRDGDPADLAAYRQMRAELQTSLDRLHTPTILPSPLEVQRRTLVLRWLSEVGIVAQDGTRLDSASAKALDTKSRSILSQIRDVTAQVQDEERGKMATLQAQEAQEAGSRVTLMWVLVGSVTFFTILIQADPAPHSRGAAVAAG
jgi:CHASE3 domain sensor protein